MLLSPCFQIKDAQKQDANNSISASQNSPSSYFQTKDAAAQQDDGNKLISPSPKSPSSISSSNRKYQITDKDRAKLTTNLVKSFKFEALAMRKSEEQITIEIPDFVFRNKHTVDIDYIDMLDWCYQREVGVGHLSIFMKSVT